MITLLISDDDGHHAHWYRIDFEVGFVVAIVVDVIVRVEMWIDLQEFQQVINSNLPSRTIQAEVIQSGEGHAIGRLESVKMMIDGRVVAVVYLSDGHCAPSRGWD